MNEGLATEIGMTPAPLRGAWGRRGNIRRLQDDVRAMSTDRRRHPETSHARGARERGLDQKR